MNLIILHDRGIIMTVSLIALANASGTVKSNKEKYNKAYYSNIINHLYSTVNKKFLNGDYDAYINNYFYSNNYLNPRFVFLEYRITLYSSIDHDDIKLIRDRIDYYYTNIMHYDSCATSLTDVFDNRIFIENDSKFSVRRLTLTLMVSTNNPLFNFLMRDYKFRMKLCQ